LTRQYTKVKQYEQKIFEMKAEGKSNSEIANFLGLKKEQIKGFVKRYNRQERALEQGLCPSKKRGRPRKRPITAFKALQKENERLQMEIKLMRDFLSAMGRK
jgi:transposase